MPQNKELDSLGLSIYILLCGFAVCFFQERISFLDASFKFFELFATEQLTIQAGRWGDCFSQLLTIATIKMCGPPIVSAFVYSISHILISLLLYFLIGRLSQYHSIRVILPLSYFIISSHGFFWFSNEQYSAYPLLIFGWCLLLNTSHVVSRLSIVGFGAISLSLMTHPLAIVAHLFILIYLYINPKTITPKWLHHIAIFTFIFIIIKINFLSNGYDNASISRIQFQNIPSLFKSDGFIIFKDHFLSDLVAIPLLLFLLFGVLYKHKRMTSWMLIFLFTLAYCFVNILANAEGAAWFHYESHFLPLSIILLFPLWWELKEMNQMTKIATLLFTIGLCILQFHNIYYISSYYKDRLSYTQSLRQLSEDCDFIVLENDHSAVDSQYQYWAASYETMTLSLIENKNLQGTIIIENIENQLFRIDSVNTIQGYFTDYRLSSLDTSKFKIRERPLRYTLLKSNE